MKLYPISGCCHCPALVGCQHTWDTCPLDTDGEMPGWLRDRLKFRSYRYITVQKFEHGRYTRKTINDDGTDEFDRLCAEFCPFAIMEVKE